MTENQPNKEVLVYLDHNVLDLMTKGDPDGVEDWLRRNSLTPVFSSENLAEIRRSVGYEEKFLEALQRIGAKHLDLEMEKFKPTGRAFVRTVDPREAYRQYIENVDVLPDAGYGFVGMLQKMYGGRPDQTMDEIFTQGDAELQDLLDDLSAQISECDEFDEPTRQLLTENLAVLNQTIANASQERLKFGSESPGWSLKEIEEATGIGAKVLKANKQVEPPHVLEKIWKLIEPHYPGVEFEVLFGIEPWPGMDDDRERTCSEKVNGIYHQLNFLGYYRDSKMHKEQRFNASFSDMTHAGLATFCHVLLCRDNDLVLKAEAAYEYLNVETKVINLLKYSISPVNINAS